MKPTMICSNPDKIVVRGEKFMICAGLLAEFYEKIGGKVEYFGKPYEEIYKYCFKFIDQKKPRVLVIGDSLENDIKGANNLKFESVLIWTKPESLFWNDKEFDSCERRILKIKIAKTK